MEQIIVAFVTGLTTGGLSCLAVQGGLLASSVAHEVEQSVQGQPIKRGKTARPSLRAGRPIVLFLAAKLVAYTILGFLLGLLGSVLQLTSTMRAVLQFAIGIFMVGAALRMFNVHPIFRYFLLEPPSAVTRFIRRTAKGQASEVTPLFLGVLTVLIPCGVTQAMMAVAMGAGDPVVGATTMFAFILGTSPVFFAVAYLATQLGAKLEAGFMRVVAVVVLLLGLVSIDTGLTLMGSPYSVGNLARTFAASPATQAPETVQPVVAVPAQPVARPTNQPGAAPLPTLAPNALSGALGSSAASTSLLRITVENGGYRPTLLHAKPGLPLQLAMVTNKTYSCARSFVIPSLKIEKVLPATGTVVIDLPAQPAGSKLFFSCSMGMYSGVIVFDG